jgi:hypothetical protein
MSASVTNTSTINLCEVCASILDDTAGIPVDTNLTKCAVIVNDQLAPGFAVNTAAVLGVSLGKLRSEMVGRDLPDSSGRLHHGITTVPIPVLKADPSFLSDLRSRLREFEPDLTVIEVISATKTTKSYEEYAAVFETSPEAEIEFFGLALYGDKKTVARFTGGLPLLR